MKDPGLLARTKDFMLEYHLAGGHSVEELKRLIAGAGHKIIKIKENPEIWGVGLVWSRFNETFL